MQVHRARYGAESLELLQRLVSEAKGANSLAPVTVVPPHSYAGIALRRALGRGHGLVNVRFLALARLAEYLGAPALARAGRRPLTRVVQMAAIRAVGGEATGPLRAIGNHPTLHESLQGAFRDMARLTDAELDELAAADALRSAVVELYRAFRARTKDRYGREDAAWEAAKAVRRGEGVAALRDVGPLLFYLPSRPSPGETALLDALAAASPCQMIVGVTGDAASDSADAWWERYAPGAWEGDVAVQGADAALPRELLPEAITVAPDAREEVRQVVREMLREAEAGIPFHRMAAVYQRPDPYATLLRSELTLAGVPVAGMDPAPLAQTAAARLVTGLCAVHESDIGRADAMRWLANAPVFDPAGGRIASSELHQWEAVSRRAGIVRGAAQWEQRLNQLAAELQERGETGEAREELSAAQVRGLEAHRRGAAGLGAFVRHVAAHAPPPDGSTWGTFAAWARESMERYAARVETWPKDQRDAYETVAKGIDELRGLGTLDGETTFAGFRAGLADLLAAPVGRSGATGTGVFVAPVWSAVGMDFAAVWVVGMGEGSYPSRVGEDPLLPEGVRQGLRSTPLRLRDETALDERRAYLAALAAAPRRRLSYARVDAQVRRGQHASPWLLEAASALAGERVWADGLQRVSAPWMTAIESLEDSLRLAADAPADGHDVDLTALQAWRQAGARVEGHPLAAEGPLARALAMERARASGDLTAWDGNVRSAAPTSRRLTSALAQVYSPTRLQSWAICPYQHFLDQVLAVAAWGTPEDALSMTAVERGGLVHRILERFVSEAVAAGPPVPGDRWPDSARARLRDIAAEEFAQAEARGVTGRRALWDVVREDILQDLDAFLARDHERREELDVRPAWVEQRFGGPSAPVTLTLPDGATLQFRGVIDRVDLSEDGARALVTDYKTGRDFDSKEMQDDPLARGKRLQLPVYALAVRQHVEQARLLLAEYWHVTAAGLFKRTAVAMTAEVEARFAEVVATIADGIRGGLFPANPGAPSYFGHAENCRVCDFRRVCPADRIAVWARKAESPDAAAYAALAAGPDGGDDADGDAPADGETSP